MNKPWLSEPDSDEFIHEGLHCLLRRGPMDHWCGYVGVDKGHLLYDHPYSTPKEELRFMLDARMQRPVGESPSLSVLLGAAFGVINPTPNAVFEVHGGIT